MNYREIIEELVKDNRIKPIPILYVAQMAIVMEEILERREDECIKSTQYDEDRKSPGALQSDATEQSTIQEVCG